MNHGLPYHQLKVERQARFLAEAREAHLARMATDGRTRTHRGFDVQRVRARASNVARPAIALLASLIR